MLRCSMTGQILQDTSDGIYDDGEWISWDWINQQIYEQELRAEYPKANPELAQLFDDLVDVASRHHEITGRYLQIWGELGELDAELKFGIKRHRPKTPGSDGRLGNDFIEIKTISPEKFKHKVQVKRAGNFNKLLVVKISEDFKFEARVIDRSSLQRGTGKHASVSWHSIPPDQQHEPDA